MNEVDVCGCEESEQLTFWLTKLVNNTLMFDSHNVPALEAQTYLNKLRIARNNYNK